MSFIDKHYSPKQQEVLRWYLTHDFFMLINHGAIRAGKTVIDNDLFLYELRRIRDYCIPRGIITPQYILAGASFGAIERNILNPIRERYGLELKTDKFNSFKLFGVRVFCLGHDDIGNLNSVTGMTAYGAYVNEATKANNEVLKQIIKRCSGDIEFHARILMDTNPDAPNHSVKVDYIDKADGVRTQAFHWTLSDNVFLSDEYVADIKAMTPSGVFYDRDINGSWCTAEGMVYRDFDESIHIIDKLPEFERYIVGVDWGYEHKGVIEVIGVTSGGDDVVIEEYAERHKTIDYWVSVAIKVQEKYGNATPFYCDTARPDNMRTFRDAGIWVRNANKEIGSGVERVAARLKCKTLKFYRKGMAKDGALGEIYSYVWDEKNGVPIKLNDDCMDATRYAIYSDDKHNHKVR